MGTYWLWVRTSLEEIKYLFKFIISLLRSGVEAKRQAFSSAIQHTILPEFSRKWETKCLNTKFRLPTLLGEVREVDFFLFLEAMMAQSNTVITMVADS